MHSNCCQGVQDASCSQFSCAAGTVSSGSPGDNANVVGAGAHVVGAHETFIQVEQLQKGLCGVSRPHFFRGVATVSLDHCLSALRLCLVRLRHLFMPSPCQVYNKKVQM